MVNHLRQLVKRVNYVMSTGLFEDFPRCSKTSLDFILWKISYSFQAIDIQVIAVPENYQHIFSTLRHYSLTVNWFDLCLQSGSKIRAPITQTNSVRGPNPLKPTTR